MRTSEIFRRRLKDARTRRAWKQSDLSQRVTELGHPLDRATIAKIEQDKRGVTLDDAVALAAALDVPLLAMLLPDEEDVFLAPKLDVPREFARGWMIGKLPLSREGVESYRVAARRLHAFVSDSEFDSLLAEVGDRERAKEMLLALIEREKREIAELEDVAVGRPDLEAAAKNIHEGIARKERMMK